MRGRILIRCQVSLHRLGGNIERQGILARLRSRARISRVVAGSFEAFSSAQIESSWTEIGTAGRVEKRAGKSREPLFRINQNRFAPSSPRVV